MDLLLNLVLFLAFVGLAALFAAMEISLVSLSRLRARSLFKQGRKGSDALVRLKDNPRRLLITILLWSNVSSVAAASLATVLFTTILGPRGLGVSVIIVTLMLVIFGDIGPKVAATSSIESFALFFAPWGEVLVRVSLPIVSPVEHIAKRFAKNPSEKGRRPLLTQDDLESLLAIAVEEGTIEAKEAKRVRDALDFNDQIVERVMTPQSAIEFFDSSLSVAQALKKSSASRHHRFPVKDSSGKVIGLVHEKLLLDANAKGRSDLPVTTVMLAPLFVKRNMTISSVFELFQKRKRKMAVVVDDESNPVGLISLEDIVEELIDELHIIEADPLSGQGAKEVI